MRSFVIVAAALAAQALAGPLVVADDPVLVARDAEPEPQQDSNPTTTVLSTTVAGTGTSKVSFSNVKRQWWRDRPWPNRSERPNSPPTAKAPISPTTRKVTTTKKTTTKRRTTTKKRTTKKKTTTKRRANSKGKPIPAGPTADTYQEAVVFHHNYHRVNHSAPKIQWSPKMASIARAIAQKCVYAHDIETGGGGYGQNIAAGAPASDIAGVITNQFYNNEINAYPGYSTNNPDMSNFHVWGHFSQVVWKKTTHVGCYTYNCANKRGGLKNISGVYSNIAPLFTVCNYSPPGNYGGEYLNVGKPIGRVTVDGNFRINPKNIKSPNPPPLSTYTKKKRDEEEGEDVEDIEEIAVEEDAAEE